MGIGEVVVLVLATWRLASLVLYERGPFDVFGRFRRLLGVSDYGSRSPEAWFYPPGEVGELLSCIFCASMWAGLGLGGLYLLSPGLAMVLSLPLALSAGASILEVKEIGPRVD